MTGDWILDNDLPDERVVLRVQDWGTFPPLGVGRASMSMLSQILRTCDAVAEEVVVGDHFGRGCCIDDEQPCPYHRGMSDGIDLLTTYLIEAARFDELTPHLRTTGGHHGRD